MRLIRLICFLVLLSSMQSIAQETRYTGEGFSVDISSVGEASVDSFGSGKVKVYLYKFGDPKDEVIIHVTDYGMAMTEEISMVLINRFIEKSAKEGVIVYVNELIEQNDHTGLQYVSGDENKQIELRMFHVETLEVRIMAPVKLNGVVQQGSISFLQSVELSSSL